MKKTKIILAILVASIFTPIISVADEGMWMVQMFESIYPKMKKSGLKLKPGEIYNAEGDNSIANAIVSLDFGCTGSMISEKGLMITNHHCAYGDIHSLSTNDNNYLEDGFWAMSSDQERHIKGKNALFLRKVIDVTDEVLAAKKRVEESGFSGMVMRRTYREVEQKHKESTSYEVMCASMWSGLKYYMFYYEVFPDVRLVGAPPVSIGAFGGETDNWGWPQHKGDFAIYRIYTGKDGKPANYSEENIPLKPTKVLNISTKGVKEGDYSMILGYPGRTARYVSSFAVKQKQEVTNPIVVEARRGKLDIWKKYMDQDPAVRLLYSDKYFGISNYTDFAKWENKCFKMYDVQSIRQAEEAQFPLEDRYILDSLRVGFDAMRELEETRSWYKEAYVLANEWTLAVRRINSLVRTMEKEKINRLEPDNKLLINAYDVFKKNLSLFDLETDRELLTFNIGLILKNIPQEHFSETFRGWVTKFNGDAKAITDYIYENSNFSTLERAQEFFSNPVKAEDIINDPASLFANAASIQDFNKIEKEIIGRLGYDPYDYKIKYVHALHKLRESKGVPQSPDANSTMRITYGTVGGINPYDGVMYDYRTTMRGYKEKEDPDNYEFNVSPKMKSLITSQDWGRWGKDGELYVNFLTNNDITGGNSGSPVLNGRGEVIGLAFDGNRESMSGDAYYHPDNFKTVCVDIRFVLWVIDKYAGAGYLIDEMELK